MLIVIDATVTQNSKNQNYVNSGVPVFLKRNTAGKISVVCDDRDIFSAFLFYLPKKGKRYVFHIISPYSKLLYASSETGSSHSL